jgi:prepilin-type N-terminal cleavage/methylation domain-containing protein
MKMFKSVRNHKGFTLVELAIVLVIIGIILGSVLKGQELINNARMKRAFNQQREITAAVYTYFDRYGFFPGDDPTAVARWAGTANGNGNGLIDGGATGTDAAPGTMFTCAAATAGEMCVLWEHLRLANIISGNQTAGTSRVSPPNAFGGTIGVANVAVSALTVNWIGLSRVPTYVAMALDTQNDDGVATTGIIRGLAAYVPATPDLPILSFFRL